MKTLDSLPKTPNSPSPTQHSRAINANGLELSPATDGDTVASRCLAAEGRSAADMDLKPADRVKLAELLQHLRALRREMLDLESSGLLASAEVHPEHRASARNLMHYLALRRHDIRQLQSQLAALGLSSLGRTEAHVMSALRAVVNLLSHLAGSADLAAEPSNDTPGFDDGAVLLNKNTEALLGPAPARRNVRIMVTMPPEAATDYALVRDLVSTAWTACASTAPMTARRFGPP